MYRSLMKEIENTKGIMEGLRALLTEVDSSYPQEEHIFYENLQKFRTTLDERGLVLLDRVLDEEEAQIAVSVIFLFWKGLQQNLSCFQDPVAKQFLNLDYEDIHQESVMGEILSHITPNDTSRQLASMLSEEQWELNPIPAYYSYIKTISYKVAHYYGFRFGDSFLPLVVPGYVSDGTSFQYALRLIHDVGINV